MQQKLEATDVRSIRLFEGDCFHLAWKRMDLQICNDNAELNNSSAPFPLLTSPPVACWVSALALVISRG